MSSIESVGDRPAHQHQEERGNELSEADEPDVEFIAGDVEDLLEQHGDQQVLADRGECT